MDEDGERFSSLGRCILRARLQDTCKEFSQMGVKENVRRAVGLEDSGSGHPR